MAGSSSTPSSPNSVTAPTSSAPAKKPSRRSTRGYDAVLMDVTLPGTDGLEATRRIRALAGACGRTPIIGISGRTAAGDEQAARTAGMDFYLRKPVSPSALSEALAAVWRREGYSAASAVPSTIRTRSLMMRLSSKSFGV